MNANDQVLLIFLLCTCIKVLVNENFSTLLDFFNFF